MADDNPDLAEVNAALSRLSGAAQGSSCAAQQASSAMFPGGLLKPYKPHIDDTFGENLKFYTNGEERSRWMSGDWDHLK